MKPLRNNPCIGCVAPKRHPGCHDTCGDYIVEKAFHNVALEEEYEKRGIDGYSVDHMRKNSDRARKSKQDFKGHYWRNC